MTIPLGGLRVLANQFLRDRAAIARYTETSTADGVEQVWALVASDVPCIVSSAGVRGVERAAAGVTRATSDWVVWLPFETDVTERDRLTIAGSDRTDGRVFEAERVAERSHEALRAVDCVLVT
jgi:hypothetical protein